ncbi:MAG: AAA family ATPase [Beijerinckiaceae bacterium]|nr:AAA family ATPase [Brevundimonas sp.]MCZ8302061.1 AAA family ATPase [Beijerinckiaceae bacterium]
MEFSPQQDRALAAISDWHKAARRKRGEPVFRLFGYAGTGKTTLARHIAEGIDGDVLFAAFTGKAAAVMRDRGCGDAQTLHSLIYRSKDSENEEPTFVLNRQSDVKKAELVIVDECSMVDAELGTDLLSFGVPVLVLGDPAQLPPVKGGGFFTEAEPDVMLTEVHRQAAGDPIIHLSMLARNGERLPVGDYGDSRVIRREQIDAQQILAADQVLVGRNETRRKYNARIRALLGKVDALPEKDEKLVCLRNNRQKGLLNGSTWTVKLVGERVGEFVHMRVAPDDGNGPTVKVVVPRGFFEGIGEEIPWEIRRHVEEFDYGYALTVHKAQGSQWDRVVLFDESFAFREHRTRWLYTAITRAAKALTVVI